MVLIVPVPNYCLSFTLHYLNNCINVYTSFLGILTLQFYIGNNNAS